LTLSGGTLVNAGATSPIGGSDTQVQFNDGGVFAGNSNFTFNKTTNQIAIAAGSAAAPTLIPSGDTNTGMWFPAADTVAWSTGSSERMRIDSAGNVGIGTSAPASRFSIYSTTNNPIRVETEGANSGGLFLAYGTTNFCVFNGRRARGTIAAPLAVSSGDFLFRLGAAGYNGSAFPNQNTAFLEFTAGENYTTTAYGTFIRFYTTALGATSFAERMRLDPAGNLGIGTTAPDALLSVNGIASFGAGAAATPSITNFGDLNTGFWFPAADEIAASTNGTERLRVDSNGNVVINTAAVATTATNGFLYVPSCAGTPTGTPTTFTGRVPIVVDATNNKLYFYSGGQWRDAGP
jgi:hypothetical protein